MNQTIAVVVIVAAQVVLGLPTTLAASRQFGESYVSGRLIGSVVAIIVLFYVVQLILYLLRRVAIPKSNRSFFSSWTNTVSMLATLFVCMGMAVRPPV